MFPLRRGRKTDVGMSSIYTWTKRKEDLQVRIANPTHPYPRCAVLDCPKPTLAYERKGLNRNYCRQHAEHYRRHGSYSKPGYTAGELNPYRKAALSWLAAHSDAPAVRDATQRVEALYWRAGRPVEAFRAAGRPPHERAKSVWAHLRERGVAPSHLLAAWLAVELRHRADPRPERRIEYRRVQAAKILHRLAGGAHKRWERLRSDGSVEVETIHRYPASRGQVLRSLGRILSWAAAPLEAAVDHIACDIAGTAGLPEGRLPRARSRGG